MQQFFKCVKLIINILKTVKPINRKIIELEKILIFNLKRDLS